MEAEDSRTPSCAFKGHWASHGWATTYILHALIVVVHLYLYESNCSNTQVWNCWCRYDTRLTEAGVAGAKAAANRTQKLDPMPEVSAQGRRSGPIYKTQFVHCICYQVLVVSPLTRALHTYQVLVVSPLTRALHTANLAFSHYDGPIVVEALARERVWLSSDCGRSPEELRAEFKGTRSVMRDAELRQYTSVISYHYVNLYLTSPLRGFDIP